MLHLGLVVRQTINAVEHYGDLELEATLVRVTYALRRSTVVWNVTLVRISLWRNNANHGGASCRVSRVVSRAQHRTAAQSATSVYRPTNLAMFRCEKHA